MTYDKESQRYFCPKCGVWTNSMVVPHAPGCQSPIGRPVLSVWEAMQHRLEALHSDFFTGQTTNATPTEPKSLTLEDLERAVHDIDPDGRFLQEARLMAACRKLDKGQVETVIRFAEAVCHA